MSLRKDQIEDEITEIRERIRELSQKGVRVSDESSTGLANYIKYLADERERTNRLLSGLTEKVSQLEQKLNSESMAADQQQYPAMQAEEINLSDVDVKILNFIETKDKQMACADEITALMNYKGRNAACARLNAMCKAGLLRKSQLGHKVYYRFDAGKATKALIISPPQ